jgi:hypothetical protein
VQGHLRNEQLFVKIDAACAHCGQPVHITLDSDLYWDLEESAAQPLVFEPEVDWAHFTGANITADY